MCLTGMPKRSHRISISRQLRLMSRPVRIRSLLFTFCWLLLALFCLSALWKMFTVLFLSNTTWPDASNQIDWTLWTPAVNMFSQPTWGIRQLWPVYIAKQILPQRGSTVFVFSSRSPFHDAVHLRDPRSIYEREQAQHLLLAVVQGLVNRIIWVYPYWRHRSAVDEFHRRTVYRVGLATIELPPIYNHLPSDRYSEPNSKLSKPQFHSQVNPSTHAFAPAAAAGDKGAPNLLNTICVCKENEHHCELPFLFPLSFSVPTDTCTRNATVLYEQVIDLLTESLLSPTSSAQSSATSNTQTLSWHQFIYGFRSNNKSPVRWLSNPVEPHKPLSHIILFDVNYFGSEPIMQKEMKTEIPLLWSPHFRALPDVPLLLNAHSLPQFHSHLKLLFNEIMSSVSTATSSTPVNWARILHLCQLYVDSLLQLLPSDQHEPTLSHWNASTVPMCGRRSPSTLVTLLSLDERIDFSHWHTRLSTPGTSLTNICAKTELLALGVLTSVDPTLRPGDSVVHLWRWLCRLNRSELLKLAEWTPCYGDNGHSAQAQIRGNSSTRRFIDPTIHLCRRPTNELYPQHPLNKNEAKLLLIRLRNIFQGLPIPRYIAMVNRSSTTSHASFDPLRTLCAYISQMY